MASRLTENQRAMIGALKVRDWRTHEITSGHSRTINSLIDRGLTEIRVIGGVRWITLTDAGRRV